MSTIQIPRHWSPQQALDFLDLLEALHQAIWDTYDASLVEIIVSQLNEPPELPDPAEPPVDLSVDDKIDNDFDDDIFF